MNHGRYFRALLRHAKARAALEGKKLKNVVNEALEDLLSAESIFSEPNTGLLQNTRIDAVGRFRIAVLRSSQAGKSHISPKDLKDLKLN